MKRQEKRVEEKKVELRPRPARGGAAPAHAEAREVPADGAAPEELDQVVSMLGDMDIEVDAVEETSRSPRSREGGRGRVDGEEQPEAEETERAPGRDRRSGAHVPPGDGRRAAPLPRGRGRDRQGDRDRRARGARGRLLARSRAPVRAEPRRAPARRRDRRAARLRRRRAGDRAAPKARRPRRTSAPTRS